MEQQKKVPEVQTYMDDFDYAAVSLIIHLSHLISQRSKGFYRSPEEGLFKLLHLKISLLEKTYYKQKEEAK